MMNMSKGKNTLDQSRSVLRARVIAGISAGALLTAFAWVSEVAAQEKLVSLHPQATGVSTKAAGVNTEHHVLGFGIFLVDVMGVAGRHQGNSHLT